MSLRRPDVILELDLTSAPVEVEPDDLLGRIRSRSRARLQPVLRALHEAGADPHVKGLVVKVGGGLPWATAQELRSAVQAFARSGKPTVAWAETFGEGGNGTSDYLLATAAGEVWLQPSGELGLMGVAAETTFLRGALDKLGVEPQLDKRHEYKNAADRITRSDFTPEHREASDRIVASVWDETVEAIAAARRISADEVRELADRAPLTPDSAVTAGLVDRVGYRDEVYADVRRRAGEAARLLFADHWSPRRGAPSLVRRHKQAVALVHAHGEIVSGRSRPSPRGPLMGSSTVCAALRAARENDRMAAVLLRVDSPGGSAVASDTIWREVELTRAAGKPVVVSMGTLAGSGGYYIACSADVIVAQPATLTGSIGVFGGKVVISELLAKVGLNTGAVEHGGSARMYSLRRGFTDDERQRIAALLDRVYTDFVAKVAAGRRMTTEAVDAVARGRVWTGADARRNGLVDELGGLRDALAIARSSAGLKADAPLRPAVHVAPLERLRRPTSSDDPRAAAQSSHWGDLAAIAQGLGLPGGPLLMPGIRLG
jgi:protease-4